jgi:glutathione S-transferase
MVNVWGMSGSGNCHKVRIVLEALGIAYHWNEVSLTPGSTRTPAFLAMNPNGKAPVAEVEPGEFLAESDAILCYFAEGTPLMPTARLARARVMQWLFFEQYSHEPYIAVARFLRRFHPDPESQRALADSKMEGGNRALAVMDATLARTPFITGDRFTIADIALFAYTHAAGDGGFQLERYPAVREWLTRVERQPGVSRMPSNPA